MASEGEHASDDDRDGASDERVAEGEYPFLVDLLDSGRVSVGSSDRENHAGDWGTPDDRKVRPDAVVWPESAAEVSGVLEAANERGIPVTPYAAGTGLEGNATPACGGISMDLTRMDAILDVRSDDFQVDVEAGAIEIGRAHV